MSLGILDAGLGRLLVGDGAFLHVLARGDRPWIYVDGQDTFEGACVGALSDNAAILQQEHPLNSYDTTYKYCRTAIKVDLDPLVATSLLAVVRALTTFMVVRLIPTLCGAPVRVTDFTALVPGSTLPRCAVTGFLHPATGEGYLYINVGPIAEPLDVLVAFTSPDYSRTGYIKVVPA